MNQPESCGCVKILFFVEFENQDEISICVVNEYLLSELLSHTARHTHLNSPVVQNSGPAVSHELPICQITTPGPRSERADWVELTCCRISAILLHANKH